MNLRWNRWWTGAAVSLIASVGLLCLALGGWQRLREAWVVHRLQVQGVEVYVGKDVGDDTPWLLFPPRTYDLKFTQVKPDFHLVSRLGKVTGLSFANIALGPADCAALGAMESLHDLSLETVTVPRDEWQYIGKLPNLMCLTIYDVSLGERGAQWLARSPSLIYLVVLNAEVSRETELSLNAVPTEVLFPRLQEAWFSHYKIGRGWFAAMADAPLVRLDLIDCHLSSDAVAELSQLKNLHSLIFIGTVAGDGLAEALRSLRELREVTLVIESQSDEVCAALGELPHLSVVSIRVTGGEYLGDTCLQGLLRGKAIRDLSLVAPSLTDQGAMRLAERLTLRSLNLVNTQISNDGLALIARLPQLVELRVPGARITDDGLKNLGVCQSLRVLDISRTQVSDCGLEHLKAVHGLEIAYVGGTHVTHAAIEALRGQRPELRVVAD